MSELLMLVCLDTVDWTVDILLSDNHIVFIVVNVNLCRRGRD